MCLGLLFLYFVLENVCFVNNERENYNPELCELFSVSGRMDLERIGSAKDDSEIEYEVFYGASIRVMSECF